MASSRLPAPFPSAQFVTRQPNGLGIRCRQKNPTTTFTNLLLLSFQTVSVFWDRATMRLNLFRERQIGLAPGHTSLTEMSTLRVCVCV